MKGMKTYIGTILLGATILVAPGCSDTWNEHYDGNTTADVATESLWEKIQANKDLSYFADILSKAKFYRHEGKGYDYTFRDFLAGNQQLTVWAPTNEAIGEAEYQRLLQLAQENGYDLQQQFIGNHIGLWRHNISGAANDTIRLINGKISVIDNSEKKFMDSPIIEDAMNQGATNGILHQITAVNTFRNNIYEYIKFGRGLDNNFHLPQLREYIIARDTTSFDRDKSIEGIPTPDGEVTYIDSVYTTTNLMFNHKYYHVGTETNRDYLYEDAMFNAYINVEDSNYVMILPKDEALEAAYKKLEPYYIYPDMFPDMDRMSLDYNTTQSRLTIEDKEEMKRKNIMMDLVSPLVFNLSQQPQINGRVWTMKDFLNPDLRSQCKYFINTFGDTLRTTDLWDKSRLFPQEDMVQLSNGAGFVVDTWDYPSTFFKKDVDIEVNGHTLMDWNQKSTNTATSQWYLTGDSVEKLYSNFGRVSRNEFLHVNSTTNSTSDKPFVNVRLESKKRLGSRDDAQVMSGKYDIYAVLVPEFMAQKEWSASELPKIVYRNKLEFTINVWNNATNPKTMRTKAYTYDYPGTKVDTVLIFSDYEIPYSYKNMLYSYPFMRIRSTQKTATPRAGATNNYLNSINIDRIILVNKDQDE